MEKLGKIIFLILNICIDVFLIALALLLALWIIWDIDPQKSVRNTFGWIENSWNALWGIEAKEMSSSVSEKLRERAHRQIYLVEPNKRDETAEDIITQPYK